MTGLSLMDRIAIEHACTRLSIDYSHLADAGQMDEWSQLFAEDGELHVMGAANIGRANIRKSVGGSNRGETITFHSASNIRIDVESETQARGTVPVTVYVVPRNGTPTAVEQISPAIIGTYHDEYRLTGEGWRFAKRSFSATLTKAAPKS